MYKDFDSSCVSGEVWLQTFIIAILSGQQIILNKDLIIRCSEKLRKCRFTGSFHDIIIALGQIWGKLVHDFRILDWSNKENIYIFSIFFVFLGAATINEFASTGTLSDKK